ncbi:hypothetical protein M758_8G183800 [Ceratodon purpureus]|nr:hypothetical protein M758_8G183800 [Ceratodon purpureus]
MGKYISRVHMLTCAHSLLSLPLPWPHMIRLTPHPPPTKGPHTHMPARPASSLKPPRGASNPQLAGREYTLQYIQGPCCSSTVPPATYSKFRTDARQARKAGSGAAVAGRAGNGIAGAGRYATLHTYIRMPKLFVSEGGNE